MNRHIVLIVFPLFLYVASFAAVGYRNEQSSAPAKIFLNGQLYIRHGTTL
ncbi:MAG: hypothetical protein IJT12_00505 [Paludibacteraceae bacterium]|nr:hypothetical protein [Paludibacteraceae bacterium]